MNIRDKLQIYIITYNRIKKFKSTLDTILNSPVKSFDMTILDNASTDGTSELIEEYCQKYSNLKHIRHSHNIGGNANICRAFEMGASSGKEYFWVLCDDDKYDFSNWCEVEERIRAKDDVICLCDYVFPSQDKKTYPSYQIFQLTFVPAGIYKTELITGDVLINMYDAILTMFQQSVVSIKCINENKNIHVLSKPIIFNGQHFPDHEDNESVNYMRGGDEQWVIERRKETLWIIGFSNIISLIKDKKIRHKCIESAITYKDIYSSWEKFYCSMTEYILSGKINYLIEIFNILPNKRKTEFILFILTRGLFRIIMQTIFSLKNTRDRKYKILTIFGFKIKFNKNNKLLNKS